MPFYQELGRHTPPPPPYSLGQRNSDSTKPANEASQGSDPPPPPPYLNSAPKTECTIPSIYELEHTVAWDESKSSHNGNAILLPPMPFQVSAAQNSNPGQGLEDYPRNQYCESIRFGIPVEPEIVPGYQGHPFRPLAELPLESGSPSAPQQNFVYNQGTGLRPDHDTLNFQSLSTVSSGQNIAPCAPCAPPHTLAAVNQQPLPTFRRHSSTNITSLANTMTLDALASFGPSRTTHSPSPLPSRQATERRATLTPVPTSQQSKTVGNVSDIQSLLGVKSDSSGYRNPSNWCGEDTRAMTQPKGHDHASPARLAGPSKHGTSQERVRDRHVSHSSHRRPSASVRFDPYKRRQSKVAGQTEQGPGSVVDKERAKSIQLDSDVEMDEDEVEVERSY